MYFPGCYFLFYVLFHFLIFLVVEGNIKMKEFFFLLRENHGEFIIKQRYMAKYSSSK